MRSAELIEAPGAPDCRDASLAERISIVSTTFDRLLRTGGIMHDGDPVTAAHVLAGTTKEAERGWRHVKRPRCRR